MTSLNLSWHYEGLNFSWSYSPDRSRSLISVSSLLFKHGVILENECTCQAALCSICFPKVINHLCGHPGIPNTIFCASFRRPFTFPGYGSYSGVACGLPAHSSKVSIRSRSGIAAVAASIYRHHSATLKHDSCSHNRRGEHHGWLTVRLQTVGDDVQSLAPT